MVPDLPDCSLKVEETQTDFTDQQAFLRETIDNNKDIHELKKEIE